MRAAWVAVVGARPNFVKLAPLVRAAGAGGRELLWVHTGQHEDPRLSRALWRDLELPGPAASLAHVPPGPRRAERMAAALRAPLAALAPGLVVVVGDVDSTVAGALAAKRLRVPLAHVEAGLRTQERSLPEERNRVRVDRLSDLLHASEPAAARALRAEGVAPARVHLAGNVMADALRWALPRLRARTGERRRGLPAKGYGVLTLHRAALVDAPARLAACVRVLARLARERPWAWPVHPRTARSLGARARRELARAGVRLLPPTAWLAFLALVRDAEVVVTDSGGLPLEGSLLGVRCLTLRARYEHALTLTHGTNRLVGGDPRVLPEQVASALARPLRPPRPPAAWDGHAAERVVARWLQGFRTTT